jgi:hypothetical protein
VFASQSSTMGILARSELTLKLAIRIKNFLFCVWLFYYISQTMIFIYLLLSAI